MGEADSVVWHDEDTFAVRNVGQFVKGQGERTHKGARRVVEGRKTAAKGLCSLSDGLRNVGLACDLKEARKRLYGGYAGLSFGQGCMRLAQRDLKGCMDVSAGMHDS